MLLVITYRHLGAADAPTLTEAILKTILTGVLFLLAVFSLSAQHEVIVACQPGLEKYYPLIRAVYGRMGLECQFLEMPSERALREVNSGNVDAEIGRTANLTSLYPNILYTKEPVLLTGLSGWVVPGTVDSSVLIKNLQKYAFGVLRGNKSSEAFVADKLIQVEQVTSLESLSQMLKSGRIQIAILPDATDSSLFGVFAIKVDIGAQKYPVYHIFATRRKDLLLKWDSTLREMKADGSYSKYLK